MSVSDDWFNTVWTDPIAWRNLHDMEFGHPKPPVPKPPLAERQAFRDPANIVPCKTCGGDGAILHADSTADVCGSCGGSGEQAGKETGLAG